MLADHLYQLDQIQPSHRLLVGDKAFYLGLMAQKGFPVIPGLVISASVLQAFLEQIEWVEPMFADLPYSSLHVDVDNPRQLQAVAQQIRQTLEAAPLPEEWLPVLEETVRPWSGSTVIVRPSIALPSGFDPTVSLKAVSLLEARVCKGTTHELAQSLKQVWAELFRAKSLLYWQRLRLQPQQVNLAVLVQPIANAIASGEVQIHQTHLDIRAIWGLGKALSNGDVAPDYYRVDLQTGLHTYQSVLKLYAYQLTEFGDEASNRADDQAGDRALSSSYQTTLVELERQTQPVLTDAQLQHLIQLAQQTATDLGFHLGLEWTLLNTADDFPGLYLTQVTPQLKMGRWEGESRQFNTAEPLPSPSKNGTQTFFDSASVPSSRLTSLLTGLAASPGTIAAPAWVSPHSFPSELDMPTGMILVAPQITPDWLPWMKQAAGIITEQGGMTSHGAVLAREIGIPAITGAVNATQVIQTGDNLWIDGNRGEVYQVVGEQQSEISSQDSGARSQNVSFPTPRFSLPTAPAATATQLFVTLSQPDALTRVKTLPIDGVGLLRSELMMLEALEQRHPDDWVRQGQQNELTDRIAQQIQQFAQALAPRPIFYRSADLRSHEFSHLQGQRGEPEPNPMLGMRGTFRYQTDPALFEIELAALRQVQQQGYNNVHLVLPFVRTVEEFYFCRQRVEQTGLTQNSLFQIWIMAEVPSVLLLLPDYIQAGVQGIAIGSNDLTQLLLGVDRDQPQMAPAFNPLHPAVTRSIQQIIQTARQAQIPCSICGEAPERHPDLIQSLVRWGITAVSVSPDAVMAVRETIARSEYALLLDAARQQLAERSSLKSAED